jgi:uncharacterized protein (TIGR02246 family)
VNQDDVAALVDEIEAAWNSHDMGRFAACFAADADFVNVAGAWWQHDEAGARGIQGRRPGDWSDARQVAA